MDFDEVKAIAEELGVSTRGESLSSLKRLVSRAVKKRKADQISVSSGFLKHFLRGELTDCSIHVRFPWEELSESNEEEGSVGSGDGTVKVRLIHAHALVLSSRSMYFQRLLLGNWRESSRRVVTIDVADEEGYDDFYLLIKLSYGPTYLKDGDRKLDVEELLRLLEVANAFDFMDAVQEYREALVRVVQEWDDAVNCLAVFQRLSDVEGMEDAADEMLKTLCESLGSVQALWEPCRVTQPYPLALRTHKLVERVTALPNELFRALITSEETKYESKNESFWLLSSWIEAQGDMSEDEKQKLFVSIAEELCWCEMTPQYLQNVVLGHKYVQKSPELRVTILEEALFKAECARRILASDGTVVGVPEQNEDEEENEAHDSITTYVTKQEIKEARSRTLIRGMGVLGGVPWMMRLENKGASSADGDGMVSVMVCPRLFQEGHAGDEDVTGLCINFKVRVGAEAREERVSDRRLFHPTKKVVWLDLSNKIGVRWSRYFREDSPYLDREELPITISTHFV